MFSPCCVIKQEDCSRILFTLKKDRIQEEPVGRIRLLDVAWFDCGHGDFTHIRLWILFPQSKLV